MRILLANLISDNCRTYTEEGIQTLAESLGEIGQLSPIGVRPEGENYRILFGNRRFYAAMKLNWKDIEATLFNVASAAEALRLQVTENAVREQMTFKEIGQALQDYMQETGCKAAEAGKAFGLKANSTTSKYVLCFTRLTDRNKKRLHEANIGFSIAYEISLANEPEQSRLVDMALAGATRKEIQKALKPHKEGLREFFHKCELGEVRVFLPRHANVEAVASPLVKSFLAEMKMLMAINNNPAWLSSTMRSRNA